MGLPLIANFLKNSTRDFGKSRSMKFFNPYEEIRVTEHYLPHWQQPGAAYFLTFRMADSLPKVLLNEWERDSVSGG